MSKLYNNGASFGFSLNYNTAVPVDTRLVVATLADLKNPETWVSGQYNSTDDTKNVYTVYPGLTVAVTADKTAYIFVADTVNGTTIADESSWSKLANSDATGAETDKFLNSNTIGEVTVGENTTYETKLEIQYVAPVAEVKYVAGDTDIPEGKNVGDVRVAGVPAHIALRDKNHTELSTVAISDIIGNGLLATTAYDKNTGKLTLTFKTADGKTKDEVIDLKEMLDINDMSIAAGSEKYIGVTLLGATEDNTQAVFDIKIQDVSTATDTSTGLVDANNVKTWVNDRISDTSVYATGDTFVNAKVDPTNNKKIDVSINTDELTISKADSEDSKLTGVSTTLVNGSEIATKVNTFVNTRISEEIDKMDLASDASDASANSANVKVVVSQTNGKIKVESVTEEHTSVTSTRTSSTTATPIDDASIVIANGGKLAYGSDIEKVANYATDIVKQEADRTKKQIADLRGEASDLDAGVSVKVNSSAGEVVGVDVVVTPSVVTASGAKNHRDITGTNDASVLTGQAVSQFKKYVDEVVADNTEDLAVTAVGDSYIMAGVDPDVNNKKVVVSANTKNVASSAGTRGTWSVSDAGVATLSDAEVTPSMDASAGTLMDGAQAISAIKTYVDAKVAVEAAERAAKIEAAVKALDLVDASVSATNVAFNYGVTDGIAHINGLKVDYTTVTRTATTSTATTPKTDATLTVANGSQLAIGSDIEKVAQYAADKAQEAQNKVEKQIADLAGNVTSTKVAGVQTQVTTAAGQVSTVVVSVDDNAVTVAGDKDARTIAPASTTAVLKGDAIAQIATYVTNVATDISTNAKAALDASITALDADITSNDETVASVQVVQVDGKITDVVVTNISAGVNRDGDAEGARVLAATTSTGAVTGADVSVIKSYVDDKVADFKSAADSSVTVKDASSFITTKINFVDGALVADESSLSYVHAVYNAESNTITTNGLADGQWVLDLVNDRVNDLDSSVKSDSTNVNVEITETDGKLTGLTVSEDYATITKTDAVLDSSHLTITTANALTVADGDSGKLVKASDLTTVYAAAKDAAKADLTVALTWTIL